MMQNGNNSFYKHSRSNIFSDYCWGNHKAKKGGSKTFKIVQYSKSKKIEK